MSCVSNLARSLRVRLMTIVDELTMMISSRGCESLPTLGPYLSNIPKYTLIRFDPYTFSHSWDDPRPLYMARTNPKRSSSIKPPTLSTLKSRDLLRRFLNHWASEDCGFCGSRLMHGEVDLGFPVRPSWLKPNASAPCSFSHWGPGFGASLRGFSSIVALTIPLVA